MEGCPDCRLSANIARDEVVAQVQRWVERRRMLGFLSDEAYSALQLLAEDLDIEVPR